MWLRGYSDDDDDDEDEDDAKINLTLWNSPGEICVFWDSVCLELHFRNRR